jgi:hypothetical protein
MKMRSFSRSAFPAARSERSPAWSDASGFALTRFGDGSLYPGYGLTGHQSSVRLNRVTAISIATSIRPASASVS